MNKWGMSYIITCYCRTNITTLGNKNKNCNRCC